VPRVVNAQEEDYSSWIKPYAERLREHLSGDNQEAQLSVTVLDGDNLADPASGTWVCGNHCCQMTTTYSAFNDGTVSMTRVTPMALQGGGPARLPAEKSRTMQKLILDLLRHPPDDHGRLPPPGRRLVLHVEGGNETVTRVYDRADIPSPVMEVLGLIGATSGPIWMDFKPSVRTMAGLGEPPVPVNATGIRVPHHRDPVTNGSQAPTATLAIGPDNLMIVTHYFFINARTMVTDRNGASIFLAVPDYELDRREICVCRASDWKHGVAVLRSGEVEAWDVSKDQKQSDLDLQGNLQDVSFSEDDSLFAVSSVHRNEDSSSTLQLGVWDTNTGQFIREMIPPYYFEHDVISRPMWWGNGKYLLANIRAGHWGGYMIAVWSVQSGQLRGGFSACDSSQDPFEVGVDGSRLLKWCSDETLLVWDIPAAIDKITEFEESLNRIR
jgi:hypothetical protein